VGTCDYDAVKAFGGNVTSSMYEGNRVHFLTLYDLDPQDCPVPVVVRAAVHVLAFHILHSKAHHLVRT